MDKTSTPSNPPGAVIGGVHYLSRTDIMQLYSLSNNKSHRLLAATNLPYINAYDRRFYHFDKATAYLNNLLKTKK